MYSIAQWRIDVNFNEILSFHNYDDKPNELFEKEFIEQQF